MNKPFFYGILLIFLFFSFVIGKKTKDTKDLKDYFLGGRKVKLFQLTLTFLATQLGGGVILGTLEASYHYGLYSLLYGLGLSLGLIILSCGLGARFRRLEVSTIAQIFEKVYGSVGLRQLSSVISLVSLFLILIAVCLSSQKLFLSLGIENKLLFILFWTGTTYYTVMGGFKAVVKTDSLQVGFILISFTILACSLFMGPPTFSKIDLHLPSQAQSFPWFSWLVSPLFFVIIGQDMGQRCFSAHSEKTVSKACFYSGVLLFVCTLLPCFLGLYAKQQGLTASTKEPLLLLSLQVFKNPYLMSLFTASVLMAILSTADSLLCAIASHVCEDFSFKRMASHQQKLVFSRTVTFVISLLSLFFASFLQEIIGLMILSYELCVSVLFVPILFSILIKNPAKQSATFAMATGFVSFLITKAFLILPGKELISLVLSAVVFLMFQRKQRKKL